MKKILIALALTAGALLAVGPTSAQASPVPTVTTTANCTDGFRIVISGYPAEQTHIRAGVGDYIPVDEIFFGDEEYTIAFPQRGKTVKWFVDIDASSTSPAVHRSGSLKCGSTKKAKKPKVLYRQFAEQFIHCSYNEVEVVVYEQKKDWYYDSYANVWLPNYSGEYEKSRTTYFPTTAQCPDNEAENTDW